MTINQRRIIVACFLIIFAVAAPLTVFYAAGYRYNTRLRRIEQAGLLLVTTEQKDIRIELDGQSQIFDRELHQSLRPRAYDITLTKDGYLPWHKRLDIHEGQTTFVTNVRLISDEEAQPFELFVNPLELVVKNASAAVYRTSDHLVFYRTSDRHVSEIQLPAEIKSLRVDLDPSGSQATALLNGAWYLATAEGVLTELKNVPDQATQVISRDGTVYAFTADKLWDLSGNTAQALLSLPLLQDAYPVDNGFWLVAADPSKQRSFLYEVSHISDRPRFIIAIPYAGQIKVADVLGRLLTVVDADNKNVHLIDAASEPAIVTTLNNVHSFAWSKNHAQLLTATDFEVTIHHLDGNRSQELIARLGTEIGDIAWHVGEDMVFYSTENAVFAAERDDRDKRNIVELANVKGELHLLAADETSVQFSTLEGQSFVIWNRPLEN